MKEKSDAPQIREFLRELLKEDWIRRSERRVWPRYAFHFTDIRNAVDILSKKCLYSRTYLESSGQLEVSSGSDEILAGTDEWIKNSVRLYFRPRTPTQYWAEGVRSQLNLSESKFPDAHCPVPVFLLFDLGYILSMPESKFSDRGLGSHHYHILSSATELEQLSWRKIYHNSSFSISDPNRADIIACRNAEIIVPNQLDLYSLKYVYCRSAPERETLIHLLPAKTYSQYANKIIASPRSDLFERRHTYLEDVRLSTDEVHLEFSPETHSLGPFLITMEFTSLLGEIIKQLKYDKFHVRNQSGGYRWSISTPRDEYIVKVYLDDALVYANSYEENELPF